MPTDVATRRGRIWLLLAILCVVIGSALTYWAIDGQDLAAHSGTFPELKPNLDPPAGYQWEFKDGPDFYVWVLAEGIEMNGRKRSGVGVYVGLHPNPAKTAGTDGQIPGRLCGQSVTWLIERNTDEMNPWVRREVLMDYDHGSQFMSVILHVWVWGPSEEVVAQLSENLEDLTFSARLP